MECDRPAVKVNPIGLSGLSSSLPTDILILVCVYVQYVPEVLNHHFSDLFDFYSPFPHLFSSLFICSRGMSIFEKPNILLGFSDFLSMNLHGFSVGKKSVTFGSI